MEDFPQLKNTEVALLRADALTGHVLDHNCILAVNNAQSVFTIYNNFQSALDEANSMVSTKVNIECVIYGIDKAVLQYLQSRNITRN